MKLIGVCQSCFVEFERGTEGSVFVDSYGMAHVSQEGHDLRQLITYLRDTNGEVLRDSITGELIPDGAETWPFLMVLIQDVDSRTGKTIWRWRKVQGIPGQERYVKWNGTEFEFAGIFDDGICTSKAFEELSAVYLTGADPAETSGTYCLGKLVSGVNDLLLIDGSTDAVSGLNPTGGTGIVVYDSAGPKVVPLCSLGADDCGDQVPPKQLVGCADTVDTATKLPGSDLPEQACAWALTWCPDQAEPNGFKPAPLGLTFWPAEALLREVVVPQSGNTVGTITELNLSSATGEAVPEYASHARVRVEMALTTDEEAILKTGEVTVGGIVLARPNVQHYAATGSNTTVAFGSGTVPLSGSALPFTLTSDADSTYTYRIWIEGYEVCPCSIDVCP